MTRYESARIRRPEFDSSVRVVKADQLRPGDVWRMDWPMESDLLALCLWNRECNDPPNCRWIGFVWLVVGGDSTRSRFEPKEWFYAIDDGLSFWVYASPMSNGNSRD